MALTYLALLATSAQLANATIPDLSNPASDETKIKTGLRSNSRGLRVPPFTESAFKIHFVAKINAGELLESTGSDTGSFGYPVLERNEGTQYFNVQSTLDGVPMQVSNNEGQGRPMWWKPINNHSGIATVTVDGLIYNRNIKRGDFLPSPVSLGADEKKLYTSAKSDIPSENEEFRNQAFRSGLKIKPDQAPFDFFADNIGPYIAAHMSYGNCELSPSELMSEKLLTVKNIHSKEVSRFATTIGRINNIPTRQRYGYFLYTDGHFVGHMSVEFFDPGKGWVPFEATGYASDAYKRNPSQFVFIGLDDLLATNKTVFITMSLDTARNFDTPDKKNTIRNVYNFWASGNSGAVTDSGQITFKVSKIGIDEASKILARDAQAEDQESLIKANLKWNSLSIEGATGSLFQDADGIVSYTTTKSGPNPWSTQFFVNIPSKKIEPGNYELNFAIRGDGKTSMTVGLHSVQLLPPYDQPGLEYHPLEVTPEWKERKIYFTIKEGIKEGDYRLPAFYMGKCEGRTVFVSDVTLRKVK